MLLSNHCGIETISPPSLRALQDLLLSNHCGIETKSPCRNWHQQAQVIIEPLWNWNQLELNIRRLPRCYYRTIVELKHAFEEKQVADFDRVIIEPLWNWNTVVNAEHAINMLLLLSNHCGIETTLPAVIYRRLRHSYYRTIVELKPLLDAMSIMNNRVIIEPLWNWNNIMTVASCMLTRLLSNHCGIETEFGRKGHYSKSSYYRTIVELKHIIKVFFQIIILLLSNHCGIETNYGRL